MAVFTLSENTNIDALTAKGGGDHYNTNGWILTIDQDSRTGLNQTTSSALGNVTVTATLGGKVNIDGTAIWMIPYTGGSGDVPAWNTTITNGTGTGKLIGVHSALTAASTATGAAMPATGFIRVKQKSGDYQAGALTGITATASDAGRVGWIEIVGNEYSAMTLNRLGEANITGAWYEIGTTNGLSNQTMQIPNNGLLRYAAGVFIEKTAGQGDYEFYPNAGTTTTTGTEAARGKVVWIDNTGLVRIGNSGAATNGYTPVAGLKVVIGNIFFENCTTADRTANVIPNSALGTRYDFIMTGGGVVNIDKCNMAWYLSCSQAYSVQVSNSGFVDAILLSKVATQMTFTKVGVGNKPTTALSTSPLTMSLCFAGGTFTDCVWNRNTMGSSSYIVNLTDISGFTFIRDTIRSTTNRSNGASYALYGTRVKNCTWTNPTVICGTMYFITCSGINVTDVVYMENVHSTTIPTHTGYVYTTGLSTNDCVFSGITFPVANNHPYTALLLITTAGCSNIKMRNIGTYASPLNLGSANACGLIYTVTAAANASNIKIQRVYTSNTRTGIMTADNSCIDVIEENVWGDYADAVDVMPILNHQRRGMGGTGALTAKTSVYGTHWRDGHTSTTAGRIAILMNEVTTATSSQVTLANGASFTSAGGLYMPVIGHTATFEMPSYIIGHTGFSNTALVMAGGAGANYKYEYAIDKNDGNGFSEMTSSSYTVVSIGTALSGITGIDASKGFKLKLKITTGTTNTSAITSVYVTTTSTTTSQAYQYILDTNTLELTGLIAGSEVRAYVGTDPATAVEIGGIENSGTSFSFTHSSGGQSGYIVVFALGYQAWKLSYTYTGSDVSIPVQQIIDRQYNNPT